MSTPGTIGRRPPGSQPAVVAGGHEATVAAALEVLDAGGNAWDAAVAGGCAATVAEPALTSLGGGGFLTSRSARGEVSVADFFVAVPGRGARRPHDPGRLVAVPIHFTGAVQDFHVGPESVAVPGTLAGYLDVHERHGRLELPAIMAPAVRLAREGVVLDRWQAHVLELLEPILARNPEGRELFFRHEQLLGAGDTMSNPALGQFLADVAAGHRHGFRAEEVGGTVTAADLDHYRVAHREALRFELDGSSVAINPPPSFGGRLVAHAARALGGGPPLRSEGSPDAALALAEALVDLAEHRRSLGDGVSRGTTHLSVVDHDGNVVALTTSNGSCSGEFAGSTGVQLNNMMGESDLHPAGFGACSPGDRIGSMMAPGVITRARRAVAIGSGGSERIRSTLTQVIARLSAGRSLADAVEAPRMHWDGSTLQVEPGWSPEVLAVLGRRWPLNTWTGRDLYFGGAHLAADDGEVAGDPRRGGVGRTALPRA